MDYQSIVYGWGRGSSKFTQNANCTDQNVVNQTKEFMDEVTKKSGILMPCWRVVLGLSIAVVCIGLFIYCIASADTFINISVWLYVAVIICTVLCCFSSVFISFGGTQGFYKQRKKNVEKYLSKHKHEILSKIPGWDMNWAFSVGSETRRVTVRTKNGGSRTENRTTYWL